MKDFCVCVWNLVTNVFWSFFAQVVYKNTSRDFIVFFVLTPKFSFLMIFNDFGHCSLKSFTSTPPAILLFKILLFDDLY